MLNFQGKRTSLCCWQESILKECHGERWDPLSTWKWQVTIINNTLLHCQLSVGKKLQHWAKRSPNFPTTLWSPHFLSPPPTRTQRLQLTLSSQTPFLCPPFTPGLWWMDPLPTWELILEGTEMAARDCLVRDYPAHPSYYLIQTLHHQMPLLCDSITTWVTWLSS